MNVPKLRFKGFSGEWEERKVGDVSSSFSGGTPSVNDKSNYGGNIPFIRSSDISKKSCEISLTEKGLNDSSAKLVKRGTLLVAMYGATSGKTGISKFEGAINQAVLAIVPNNGFANLYLYSLLNYQKNQIINKYIQGGQGNLSGKIINNLLFYFPNLLEQQKIGEFFKKIDKLIELQTKKLESLKKLKQGHLQKMFPQDGEKVPRFRFKGFSDQWEEKFVGNLIIHNNIRNKDNLIKNVESISNKKGFINQKEQFDDYSVASKDLSNYFIIKPGMFAYNPSRINVGSIAYKYKEQDVSIVSPLYVSFKTRESINDLMFLYWFKTESFRRQREKYSEGGVRDTLSFKALSEFKLSVTSVTEQKRITSFFENINSLIELQENKLAVIKEQKKAYLQKMFI